MTRRLRLAAVAMALLIPALVLGRWLLVAGMAKATVPTPSLPHHLGSWRATSEDRLDAEVLAIIEPDAHVLQLYEAPGRTPIWVYVGVYGGRAGYGKGAHDPEVCYPAQGWEVLRSESLEVPLTAAEKLRTRRLEAHLGVHKEAVLYWFQPANRWPAPGAAEELLRVLDAAKGRPQYAFVRLSGPSDGGPAAARDLAEFAAEIAAPIRAVLEAIGSEPNPVPVPRRSETSPERGHRSRPGDPQPRVGSRPSGSPSWPPPEIHPACNFGFWVGVIRRYGIITGDRLPRFAGLVHHKRNLMREFVRQAKGSRQTRVTAANSDCRLGHALGWPAALRAASAPSHSLAMLLP